MRSVRWMVVVFSGLFMVCAVTAAAQGRGRGGRQGSPEAALAPGTPIDVRLVSKIETEVARDGDSFTATVASPVMAGGRTVLAKDTQVTGRVIKAVSSGRLKQPAQLVLELVRAGRMDVQTEPVTLDGKSHTGRNAALIGGGAAAGAIIGAIAGGGKGAAIGAAAGAGAGTATAYFTGKKELVLPPEMEIQFVVAGSAPSMAAGANEGGSYRGSNESDDPSVFSDRSRRVIGDYLRNNRGNLPPGLAKRDRLPPGLERQLQRNGTLPPGLQKRVAPFPQELDRQLPVLPSGMSRVFLGNRAILLDRAQRILDLFTIEE